jgi:hypothetical protein
MEQSTKPPVTGKQGERNTKVEQILYINNIVVKSKAFGPAVINANLGSPIVVPTYIWAKIDWAR